MSKNKIKIDNLLKFKQDIIDMSDKCINYLSCNDYIDVLMKPDMQIINQIIIHFDKMKSIYYSNNDQSDDDEQDISSDNYNEDDDSSFLIKKNQNYDILSTKEREELENLKEDADALNVETDDEQDIIFDNHIENNFKKRYFKLINPINKQSFGKYIVAITPNQAVSKIYTKIRQKFKQSGESIPKTTTIYLKEFTCNGSKIYGYIASIIKLSEPGQLTIKDRVTGSYRTINYYWQNKIKKINISDNLVNDNTKSKNKINVDIIIDTITAYKIFRRFPSQNHSNKKLILI